VFKAIGISKILFINDRETIIDSKVISLPLHATKHNCVLACPAPPRDGATFVTYVTITSAPSPSAEPLTLASFTSNPRIDISEIWDTGFEDGSSLIPDTLLQFTPTLPLHEGWIPDESVC
jgi:hypothetical protein